MTRLVRRVVTPALASPLRGRRWRALKASKAVGRKVMDTKSTATLAVRPLVRRQRRLRQEERLWRPQSEVWSSEGWACSLLGSPCDHFRWSSRDERLGGSSVQRYRETTNKLIVEVQLLCTSTMEFRSVWRDRVANVTHGYIPYATGCLNE